MDRRFEVRKAELLAGCRLSPDELDGARERLHELVAPFAEKLVRSEQKAHAREYVEGLVSDLDTKNAESIAYLHGMGRKTIQHFLGESAWDHEPIIDELARRVADEIGEPDAVIVFDPSAHAKSGDHSVGVKRQWCPEGPLLRRSGPAGGRLGKRENCLCWYLHGLRLAGGAHARRPAPLPAGGVGEGQEAATGVRRAGGCPFPNAA